MYKLCSKAKGLTKLVWVILCTHIGLTGAYSVQCWKGNVKAAQSKITNPILLINWLCTIVPHCVYTNWFRKQMPPPCITSLRCHAWELSSGTSGVLGGFLNCWWWGPLWKRAALPLPNVRYSLPFPEVLWVRAAALEISKVASSRWPGFSADFLECCGWGPLCK